MVCKDCGKEIEKPNSNRQKYCDNGVCGKTRLVRLSATVLDKLDKLSESESKYSNYDETLRKVLSL